MYKTINEADEALCRWVKSVITTESIAFGAPTAAASGSAVNAYLLIFAPAASHGMQSDTPMQLLLRYLITVWAESPEREHELLTKLAFGALQQSDFQVGFEALPDSLWSAFAITPRPCFFITVPVMQFRATTPVRLVEKPLITHPAFRGIIAGRVVDGKGEPVPNARITLPPLFDGAVSEAGGKFVFRNIPAELTYKQIGSAFKVTVNGREREVSVVQDDRSDGAISFTITLAEA